MNLYVMIIFSDKILNTMASNKYFCGDCSHGYSRKEGWEEHYNLKQVKVGGKGKLIDNPCYNRKRKICARSLEEVSSL